MVEGQLRDSTRSILTFFNTTRTRVRSRYRPTTTGIHPCQMGRTGRKTRAGFWSGVHPGLPVAVDTCKLLQSGLSQSAEDQPASHEHRAGDRPAEDRVPEETDRHGDSRWDIPRKWALFTSDGTDSTTIGSNTPESHADWPPEVKCLEGLITDKRQSAGGAERLCFSHIQLEMAVNQLHRDVEECRAERELARNQTDSDSNPPTSEAVGVHIDAGSEILREIKLGTVPRGVRGHCVFEWPGRCHGGPTAAIPSGRRCTQCSFTGSGVSKGEARIFDKVVIRAL